MRERTPNPNKRRGDSAYYADLGRRGNLSRANKPLAPISKAKAAIIEDELAWLYDDVASSSDAMRKAKE